VRVDRRHAHAEPHFRLRRLVELRTAQQQALAFQLAGEVFLGQRRAVVRQVGLVADQRHRPRVACAPQGVDRLHRRMAGAHDHHGVRRHLRLLLQPRISLSCRKEKSGGGRRALCPSRLALGIMCTAGPDPAGRAAHQRRAAGQAVRSCLVRRSLDPRGSGARWGRHGFCIEATGNAGGAARYDRGFGFH
jgi:hypothetical protein